MKLDDMVLISVDDHVVEPPNCLDGRLPARFAARTPRIVRNARGHDVWVYEGREVPNIGLNAVSGRPPEDYGMEPTSYEQIRRGTWDVDARIDDMNANGVLSSLCFPSFPSFCGKLFLGTPDREFALAVTQAYNDWHLEEWCGSHPGRFIPMAVLPLWDPAAAAAELRRCTRRGARAFTMLENPESIALPSFHDLDYWSPLWRACCDEAAVVCIHIGTGKELPTPSLSTPIVASMAATPLAIGNCAADLVFSQVPQQFPELRFALSESGIGWIPYFLERCDYVEEQHRGWTHTNLGGARPSEVFRRQFMSCFFQDRSGILLRDEIGVECIAWECDYPHSDSTWPESPEVLYSCLEGVSDEEIELITHTNAMRWWNFDPVAGKSRAQCTVGALRAAAEHVDTDYHRVGEGLRPLEAGVHRTVTVGDVRQQLASVMDG
jgi:predicted TIM-barrel fold metal-dependent hydrolase